VIIVISGPGGVGKGTAVARLVAADPRLRLSRSWTTRPPRPHESADHYVFAGRTDFEERIAAGGFLEWAEFQGHLYGTPVPDVAAQRAPDSDLVLEIDVQGAAQVRQRFPDALLLFIDAPSRDAQRRRLVGRGDDPDAVERRLAIADREAAAGHELGAHVVINDDLDDTVVELLRRIDGARPG